MNQNEAPDHSSLLTLDSKAAQEVNLSKSKKSGGLFWSILFALNTLVSFTALFVLIEDWLNKPHDSSSSTTTSHALTMPTTPAEKLIETEPSSNLFDADSQPLSIKELEPEIQSPQTDIEAKDISSNQEVVQQGHFDREKILSDTEKRISAEFHIPENLRQRAGFWFDVYTKYDEFDRIIHHTRFPWLIFKVVNVREIIMAPAPKHRWMRNLKAEQLVKDEEKKVKQALLRLAGRPANQDLTKLPALERSIAEQLKTLGGSLQHQAKIAASDFRMQVGQKNFFEGGLRSSQFYLPTMESIFHARGLPIELTRLPLVESSFNLKATSDVGAAGIWQLMPSTAKKFMIVSPQIDERRSPLKSTEAAARLMRENYQILRRSWPLALTAYNHGPMGVRRAALKSGTYDLGEIIKRYQTDNFNFASSNFFCEFLGALHAQFYNDQIWPNFFNSGGSDTSKTVAPLTALKIAPSLRLQDIIKTSGLSKLDLIKMNPELSKAIGNNDKGLKVASNILLPRGFRLYLPTSVHSRLKPLMARAMLSETTIIATARNRPGKKPFTAASVTTSTKEASSESIISASSLQPVQDNANYSGID